MKEIQIISAIKINPLSVLPMGLKQFQIYREFFFQKFNPFEYFKQADYNLSEIFDEKNCAKSASYFLWSVLKKNTEPDSHSYSNKILNVFFNHKVGKNIQEDQNLKNYNHIDIHFDKVFLLNSIKFIFLVKKKAIHQNIKLILRHGDDLVLISSVTDLIKIIFNKKIVRSRWHPRLLLARTGNTEVISVFDMIKMALTERITANDICLNNRIILAKPDVFLFFFKRDDSDFVGRIALDERSFRRLKSAKNSLDYLRKNIKMEFLKFPEVEEITDTRFKGFFIETRLSGSPTAPSLELSEKIIRSYSEFQELTKVIISSSHLIQRIFDCQSDLNVCLDEKHKIKLDAILNKIIESINTKEIIYAVEHGDLKIENILFDSRSESFGLIDWDLSFKLGIPYIDFLFFEFYNRVIRENISFTDFMSGLIHDDGFNKIFQDNPEYKHYNDLFLAEPQEFYIVLFWLHHVTFRMGIRYIKELAEENIHKPIEWMHNNYVS